MNQTELFDVAGLLIPKVNGLDLKGGCVCPTCGQFAKEYRRKLHATMALSLINLYKIQNKSGVRWVHFNELATFRGKYVGGDINKLTHWGLVAQKINEDSNKRKSGFWGITLNGKWFVEERLSVPSHIVLYNNRLQHREGKPIYITDALGDKFDYKELMGAKAES